jgi:TPP-dependent pyruvate/acetoin dehydrogenase alpha subunit
MAFEFNKKQSLETIRLMLTSRRFEEKVNEMFMQGLIHGTTHLGIGQEALHAGVSPALDENDWILPNHRGHGHCIAKGSSPYDIMAELMAVRDGVCRGMGGSMHIIDTRCKNMGSSGIVGSAIPMATGMALQMKREGKKNIVCTMFGDAASNRGTFHEALNMASIWNIPVLYLVENNLYGMSVPARYAVSVEDIAVRGTSYNIESRIIDGNDVELIYSTVKEIADGMRKEPKPFLLEAKTYRWLGHSKSDRREYRTKEEEAEWKSRCPIEAFRVKLLERGYITEKAFDKMKADVESAIDEAADRCRDKEKVGLEEALAYVYSS